MYGESERNEYRGGKTCYIVIHYEVLFVYLFIFSFLYSCVCVCACVCVCVCLCVCLCVVLILAKKQIIIIIELRKK